MLQKEVVIDKIEILPNGIVQVRQATRILENDSVISQTYHRWTIAPGDDYSNQEDKIKSICEITHTPDVVNSWQAGLEAYKNSLGQ